VTTNDTPNLRDAAWLTRGPLAQLLAILDRDGEEARVVGGAVRNALLDEPLGDIDVATTARPDVVIDRAEAAGLRAVPTGIAHGTVTVLVEKTPFEVTTLREDIETFGRHATVLFGRDWKADAERRDFTMNALSATRDGQVHDLVGGLADLRARRVRFIGEPAQRIREDYLRILRFFRFHAVYGRGELDPAGLAAAIHLRAGLAELSRERVRAELMKLLPAPGAVATLTVMADAGLLGLVLAVAPAIASLARLVTIEAAMALAADPVRRLGALAVHVGDDAENLWQRLRLANVERDRLASMADGWWRIAAERGERAMRAVLYRLGAERFVDRVLFAWVRSGDAADDPTWLQAAMLAVRWDAPRFPLKAGDFIQRGIAPGPELGRALAQAEDDWIAADFPYDHSALDAIVASAMASG
jgi:poly(A) polymerase